MLGEFDFSNLSNLGDLDLEGSLADALEHMSTEQLDQIFAALFVGAGIFVICYFWGMWRIFQKMNVSGWKIFVPLYSNYILFERTWRPAAFWFFLWFSVICGFAPTSNIPHKMIIYFAAAALQCLMQIILCHKLSRAFGHGIIFTLGLILLAPVFILVLGLGKSEYHVTV